MSAIPSTSINGPHTLRIISLTSNGIHSIKEGAFAAQPGLEKIRLDHNDLNVLEGSPFSGLSKLRELTLSQNTLARFNSDVFQGKNFSDPSLGLV